MDLIERFLIQFPEIQQITTIKSDNNAQITLLIPDTQIVNVCFFMRDSPGFLFDYLTCLTALDFSDYFEVVYHIESVSNKALWVLKVQIPKKNEPETIFIPEIHSVSSVWLAANWYEREAYDLLGIKFINHPNLERILMPEDWQGFPLRKDYKNPTEYHQMPTAL